MWAAVLATLAAASCLAAPAHALFDGSKHVVQADPDSYTALVERSRLMWVTVWYAEDDPKSQQLAKLVEEAAGSMHKFGIRFAAVDAGAHPDFALKKKGTDELPGLSICNQPPLKNPYTGAEGRQALSVTNPHLITNAKLIKQLVSQQMPEAGVKRVSNKISPQSFASLLEMATEHGASHAAVYVSKKMKASPLVKSVAMQFAPDRLAVGEVLGADDLSAASLAKQLGVQKVPAFVLVPAATQVEANATAFPGTLVLGGNPTFEAITAFVEEHVAPAPDPVVGSGGGDNGGGAPGGGGGFASSAYAGATAPATAAELDKVLATEDALVVLVAATAEALEVQRDVLGPVVAKAQSQGKTGVVVVDCVGAGGDVGTAAVCTEAAAADAGVVFLSYAHGKPGASTGGDSGDNGKRRRQHASLKKAFGGATQSLPTGRVARVDPISFQQRLSEVVSSDPPRVPVVLLTSKDTVPAMLENAAEEVGDACVFMAVSNPPPELLAGLGDVKLPSLLLLVPMADPDNPERVGFQGLPYDPAQFGKFTVHSVTGWAKTALLQMGINPSDYGPNDDVGGGDGGSGAGAGSKSKVVDVPFEELTADNFQANCLDAGGLCLVALLNGADDNAAHLAELKQLHAARDRGGYAYSWAAAQCHPEFLSQFGLDVFALPTVVAVSPRKGAFTRFVGKFMPDDIARFARRVMRGRGGEAEKLPGGGGALAPPDGTAAECAAVVSELRDDGSGDHGRDGGGDGDGDGLGDDEALAEFVREAAAQREREAAEAAAEAAAAEANRDPCDDPNLNEWGQKECRAKADRQRELEEEKQRLADEIRAKRKAKKNKKKKGKKKGKKSKKEL